MLVLTPSLMILNCNHNVIKIFCSPLQKLKNENSLIFHTFVNFVRIWGPVQQKNHCEQILHKKWADFLLKKALKDL